jgi:DNA topoisomerase-1
MHPMAEAPRLVHLNDDAPGITRRFAGRRVSYVDPRGKRIRDATTLARVRALAVPPAWTDVWISPQANSHLQATGRDARGRKQYRYHAAFRAFREEQKFEHVTDFAKALPAIRRVVRRHMALPGLPREKVLATIVYLLETTLIRVGNADYARNNKSYGLTTLRDPHVDVAGSQLRFHFKGKSGKTWRLKVTDRRVAKIVKACQDLPGQHLFQYRNGDNALHEVTSTDVNAYLREITGRDVTAKDFRTWAGTVLAAFALQEFEAVDSQAAAKRNIRSAIEQVAERLGNTMTICRKCYVHPTVIETYMAGALILKVNQRAAAEMRSNVGHLRPEEAAVLALLQSRLKRELRKSQKRAA